MYIQTNENHTVTGYSATEMIPAVIYEGDIPIDFYENWRSYRLIDGKLVYDDSVRQNMLLTEELLAEQEALLAWFMWYDNQIMQYERCVRLGEQFDRDIAELDAEANAKQLKLRRIRIFLHGEEE